MLFRARSNVAGTETQRWEKKKSFLKSEQQERNTTLFKAGAVHFLVWLRSQVWSQVNTRMSILCLSNKQTNNFISKQGDSEMQVMHTACTCNDLPQDVALTLFHAFTIHPSIMCGVTHAGDIGDLPARHELFMQAQNGLSVIISYLLAYQP